MDKMDCFKDAYQKGRAARLMHIGAHCVLEGQSLQLLASDFAHLFLFSELHNVEVKDPHSRASLRMDAFQKGYALSSVHQAIDVVRAQNKHPMILCGYAGFPIKRPLRYYKTRGM